MRNRSASRFAFAAGLVLAAVSFSVTAADFYVDQQHPAASDANPGTEDRPWKTLFAATRAPLQPGDNVLVKPGVYDTSGGMWSVPAINPPVSGAPGRPITFRSTVRHGAVLDAKGDPSPIGVSNRSHIVIDGFEVITRGHMGVVVFGEPNARVQDIVLQNLKVHGMRGPGTDNTDGIRVQWASNVVVRNNEIYDITNEKHQSNASGVKLYYTDHVIIEQNEIYDVVDGVKDKEQGVENHVRYNYIHDCSHGMMLMTQNSTTTAGYYFYQNIVANCRDGFGGATQASAVLRKVYIYNNLFYGYRGTGIDGTHHGEDRRVWNNIFYPAGAPFSDITVRRDSPTEFQLIDYNLYAQEPSVVVGLYSSNRWFRSLADWQRGFGFDRNSLLADPRLLDPARGDFRLAAGSPARGAGRVDGRPTGAAVNLGPYITGSESIGVVRAGAAKPAAMPPSPPTVTGVR